MVNSFFYLYQKLICFNLNKFLLCYILPHISVFQFCNLCILVISLFILFINFILKKYSKIQKLNFFKSLLKRMCIGFILTLLIFIVSQQMYCNNSINNYIVTNFLNTQFKKDVAMYSLLAITTYGVYKISSAYYLNVINQKDNYLKKKEDLINNTNINKSILDNYENKLKKYESDLITYENRMIDYRKKQIEYQNILQLENEYNNRLNIYNLSVERNETLKKLHLDIINKIKTFQSQRNLFNEETSLNFKHLYIANSFIDNINKNEIIDGHIIYWHINNAISSKKLKNSNIPYESLKTDCFKEDIIDLSNKAILSRNNNQNFANQYFCEEKMDNSFINILTKPSISLISSEDLNVPEILEGVKTLSKKSTRNISDSYISDKFIASQTVLEFVNFKNKFNIDVSQVKYHKLSIETNFIKVEKTYKNLCNNSIDILNFIGTSDNIGFKDLLKKNLELIEMHNIAWTNLIHSILDYSKEINIIKGTNLVMPEVIVSINLGNPIQPVKPTQVLEPIYLKLEYKSTGEIPIIDLSESYLNGLRFASINAGYTILYPTFFFLDFFLGTGNPIPKELFYKSLNYWIHFKIFYGK